MKRLIVCADGTWQKLTSPYPTNVVKIAQAIKPSHEGISQIVFYDEGVGSGNTAEKLFAKADRILGGAFGIGIDNNIQEAYRFLSLNYEPGDQIYLFGFSRGAYTVRSLAGLINCSGGLLSLPTIREAPFAYELYRDLTLTPNEKAAFRKLPLPHAYYSDPVRIKQCRAEAHAIYSNRRAFHTIEAAKVAEKAGKEEARLDLQWKREQVQQLLQKYNLVERQDSAIRQKAKITLLACWDTVGSLGVPNHIPLVGNLISKKYQFHDTELSSCIENALHAVAIDEHRKVFDVTPMAKNQDAEQLLHEVWFPGAHGCVGGGSQAERMFSDRALEWMMDEIAALKLGLEFDRTVVEDGIRPDLQSNPTIAFDKYPAFYKALGEKRRDLGDCPIVDPSAAMLWNICPTYRPSNLIKYAREHGWCDTSPSSSLSRQRRQSRLPFFQSFLKG